ncbi:glycoside hydrolase family 15 protein [bacterium]
MKNYDYGIIGNCTSAALVGPDCSIDWMCLPFFDSPSIFAKLMDQKKGGYFRITANNIQKIEQEYVYNTSILKTRFMTDEGVFEVRDYMPRYLGYNNDCYCPPEVQRYIIVISGTPKVIVELAPKPNYAISGVDIKIRRDCIKMQSSKGEHNSFYMYTNLDKHKVLEGKPIKLPAYSYILLAYHEKIDHVTLDKVYTEYELTKSYWLSWTGRTRVPNSYKDLTIRSAITLKLLTYQRTGAVIAAPTMSLPEIIGKNRNWDYRYCWVRDASMIIDLYARMAHMGSARNYIQFILNRMLLKHENIAVLYGINGEKKLDEKILKHLSGYENSKPVRIGNAAYKQVQNDLYGEIIEMIYTYFNVIHKDDLLISEEIWTVVRSLVNNVKEIWREPDSGIWERRGGLEHYVYSKMMNWVAMDRAAKIASLLGKRDYAHNCLELAKEIKNDILRHGWDEKLKSFTMHYGSKELDASNLLMLHYGFLPKDDPRIISTVKQTYKYLVKDNFVFRYTAQDDFGEPENAFIICSFWMINALLLIGDGMKAKKMFEHIIGFANEFGLFSEDVEIATGRLTGNFPQGYSHMALIQTVFLLETKYNWSDNSRIHIAHD